MSEYKNNATIEAMLASGVSVLDKGQTRVPFEESWVLRTRLFMTIVLLSVLMTPLRSWAQEPSKDNSEFHTNAVPGDVGGNYRFYKNYIRAFAKLVHIPSRLSKTASIYITITTLNNNPLKFNAALECQPNVTYSDPGEIVIIPYVALNVKAPLQITAELRTRSNASSYLAPLQGILGTAANILTGGALNTISTVTRYANASHDLLVSYEQATQHSDFSRCIKFDNPTDDAMQLRELLFIFCRSDGTFDTVDENDHHRAIHSYEVLSFKTLDEKPSSISPKGPILLTLRSGNSPGVYLADNQAYVVVRCENYQPYRSSLQPTDDWVYNVVALRPHFDVIIEATHKFPDNKAAVTAVLQIEASKLGRTLRILTDAGDLSTADANDAWTIWLTRAKVASASPYFTDLARLR